MAGGLVTWAVYPLDAEFNGYAGIDLKWVQGLLAILIGTLSFAISMAITLKTSSGEASSEESATESAKRWNESTLWLLVLALLSIQMNFYHSSLVERIGSNRVGLFAIAAGVAAARILWWLIRTRSPQEQVLRPEGLQELAERH